MTTNGSSSDDDDNNADEEAEKNRDAIYMHFAKRTNQQSPSMEWCSLNLCEHNA